MEALRTRARARATGCDRRDRTPGVGAANGFHRADHPPRPRTADVSGLQRDGRVFVAEKSGVVKVFDGLGDTTPSVFADMRTKVYNELDRGMMGIALAPGFPTDPSVYVPHAPGAAIGATAPRWVSPTRPATRARTRRAPPATAVSFRGFCPDWMWSPAPSRC
ncbi:PQQ-dependent sugar dehydrogenase [Kibdelosporangium phytohabitans]|uniref:PQQ-dependent sugar dehydrogenase n=1 Tax=Kibdelosporangium phytohabitans TaxID=860235 RepID=UPI000B2B45A1